MEELQVINLEDLLEFDQGYVVNNNCGQVILVVAVDSFFRGGEKFPHLCFH